MKNKFEYESLNYEFGVLFDMINEHDSFLIDYQFEVFDKIQDCYQLLVESNQEKDVEIVKLKGVIEYLQEELELYKQIAYNFKDKLDKHNEK